MRRRPPLHVFMRVLRDIEARDRRRLAGVGSAGEGNRQDRHAEPGSTPAPGYPFADSRRTSSRFAAAPRWAHLGHGDRHAASAVTRAADPDARPAAGARSRSARRAGPGSAADHLTGHPTARDSRPRRVPRSGVVRRGLRAPVELASGADGAHDRDARRLDAVGILTGECGPGPAELVAHAPAFVAPEHGGMLDRVAQLVEGTVTSRPYFVRAACPHGPPWVGWEPCLEGRPWVAAAPSPEVRRPRPPSRGTRVHRCTGPNRGAPPSGAPSRYGAT